MHRRMNKQIAVLGLGAMGRRMALRLQAAGHTVSVWSRSGLPAGGRPLQQAWRDTPGAALQGAEIVISMLRDDEASREVWLGAEHSAVEHIRQDTLVLECGTVTPAWALELGARVQAAGGEFLDAPVLGSTPQADAGKLIFLVGGGDSSLPRAEPVFSVCGGARHHLGGVGAGSRGKLLLNALFAVQVAALAELLPTVREGLSPGVLNSLADLPVFSPAAKAALAGMLAEAFEPLFPIELVVKDLTYAVRQGGTPAELPVTQRAREVFQAAEVRGLGDLNLTALAKLYA